MTTVGVKGVTFKLISSNSRSHSQHCMPSINQTRRMFIGHPTASTVLAKFTWNIYTTIPDGLHESDVHKDETSDWSDTEEKQVETVNVEIVVESVVEWLAIRHDINPTYLVAARVDQTNHTAVQEPATRFIIVSHLSLCRTSNAIKHGGTKGRCTVCTRPIVRTDSVYRP